VSDSPVKNIVAPIPHRRRARWLLRGFVAVPIVFLVVAALLWCAQSRTVARKLAAIRERGEPTTLAELDAFYKRPPPDTDATELWLAAFKELAATHNEALMKKLPIVGLASDAPPPGQPWKELSLAEQFLSENAAAMQPLHAAARKGGSARYPIDLSTWSATWSSALTCLEPARQGARFLKLEIHVRAHHDDAAGVADSISTGLLLARSFEFEPVISMQLVRNSIELMMIDLLKQLLPVMRFSDADLSRLQQELLAPDFRENARRVLAGERAQGIALFDELSSAPVGNASDLASRAARPADMANYLTSMQDYVLAAEKPWPEALAATDAVSSEFGNTLPFVDVLAPQMASDMGLNVEFAARAAAVNRIAALAIALERYRRAKAKPPATLDELAPQFIREVPLDPYTGKAFNYQETDASYVIYSLGGWNKDATNTDAATGALETLLFRWPPKPAADVEAAPTGEGR
jgi:hypothetical protein